VIMKPAFPPAFFIPEKKVIYNLLIQNSYLYCFIILPARNSLKNNGIMFIFVR
jgi:hypothetical protein